MKIPKQSFFKYLDLGHSRLVLLGRPNLGTELHNRHQP